MEHWLGRRIPLRSGVTAARARRAESARTPRPRRATLLAAAAALATLFSAWPALAAPAAAPSAPLASAQPDTVFAPYEDRPIREVRLVGLEKVSEQLVRNQIRARPGQPLRQQTIQGDIRTLNRLGRFRRIDASVEPLDDGSVILVYVLDEAPVVVDVQVVGNRRITDQDIARAVEQLRFLPGTPVDDFQLDRAARRIEELYRDRGYHLAEVTIDERELEESGIVLFRIREGERIRVAAIRFEGNRSFSDRQLRPSVRTRRAGLFERGPLDDEALDRDVAQVVNFYQDRGYLDVRADRRIRVSPDGREAIVTFLIDEGERYTLRSVRAELADAVGQPTGQPPTVMDAEQIAGLMRIKAGDVYSMNRIRESVRAVRDAYHKLGYVDAEVRPLPVRDVDTPQVDLLLAITEGRRYDTGLVIIRGNDLTQQKVIRREIRLRPDRPLDRTAVAESQQRLEETRLFRPGSAKVTIQPENPGLPGVRDVLVEVEEHRTGALSFGAAIDTDGGLTGQIRLTERNFDITNLPDSIEEFFTGRSFRGGGQQFEIAAQPGTQIQTYSISLVEPSLFDTDYSGSVTGFYRTRRFRRFDEDRIGANLGIGRRFGERWNGSLTFRVANVNIRRISSVAPTDIFDFQGDNFLTAIGARMGRTTTDSRFRPTRGTRTEFSVEQVGAMGGDFDFTKLQAEHAVYIPVYEDFMGNRTVLRLQTLGAYIPQSVSGVPIFERYFLGGRSMRGFRFRTVSPKGIRADTGEPTNEPVGGTWAFFLGAQIEQPVWRDVLAVVAFVDSGTVTNEVGFDDYRVSVGTGLRLYVQALGPVPLAFDFGFPLRKQADDERRIFSFSIDLPF